MTGSAVWAGVIVAELSRAVPWYVENLICRVAEHASGWASLTFPDGSGIELFEGDPAAPGRTFPSYRDGHGPPVLPGFAVDDPQETAQGLRIARHFPGWIVVVAPDGLRVVLLDRERRRGRGLTSFRVVSPDLPAQQAFFDGLGLNASVSAGPTPGVTPVFAGGRVASLHDPDGNELEMITRP